MWFKQPAVRLGSRGWLLHIPVFCSPRCSHCSPRGSWVISNPRRDHDTSLLFPHPLPGRHVTSSWQQLDRNLILVLRKLHVSIEPQGVDSAYYVCVRVWHMASAAWGGCGSREFLSCCVELIHPHSDGGFPNNGYEAEGQRAMAEHQKNAYS